MASTSSAPTSDGGAGGGEALDFSISITGCTSNSTSKVRSVPRSYLMLSTFPCVIGVIPCAWRASRIRLLDGAVEGLLLDRGAVALLDDPRGELPLPEAGHAGVSR